MVGKGLWEVGRRLWEREEEGGNKGYGKAGGGGRKINDPFPVSLYSFGGERGII